MNLEEKSTTSPDLESPKAICAPETIREAQARAAQLTLEGDVGTRVIRQVAAKPPGTSSPP